MSEWGRDEMNLVELPFGPITGTESKTYDVTRSMFDPILKRNVTRRVIITGSDAFGLPRPIDDQVLVGMKALTCEAGFNSRKVSFSRYQLCRTIGWSTDGRAYKRLEASLNRIAGTTLQFKDAWYDKGETEFKSKTFHLIEEVDLCSRDRLERSRLKSASTEQRLCYFVWNEVIWKSFQDGFIRKLNMNTFRKIASGRRREVPVRLYRILDKRFYRTDAVRFDMDRLALGILGLSPNYSPSQVKRIVGRAAKWLVACEYLSDYRFTQDNGRGWFIFQKFRPNNRRRSPGNVLSTCRIERDQESRVSAWFTKQCPEYLDQLEVQALEDSFGSALERDIIREGRLANVPITKGGAIRQNYAWQYWRTKHS